MWEVYYQWLGLYLVSVWRNGYWFQISSVQWSSHVQLFATPWTTACQASLSITNSQSLPKLMSIESVMPSNHLVHCRPLLLPSVFPSIRLFFHESAFLIKWPKLKLQLQHQSFQWIFRVDFLEDGLVGSLCCPRDTQVFSNITVQKHQFFGAQPSLWFNSHICAWLLEKP